MEFPVPIFTLLEALAATFAYSMLWYQKRRFDPERPGETFKPRKMAATLLVGLAVGTSMYLAGDPLSQTTFGARMAAYAGSVALVEAMLDSLRNAYACHTGTERRA